MTLQKALIIAPHPDDAEIFMGGTIAYLKSINFHVTILDLTKGELSSRGNLEIREKEKTLAASILSIDQRLCAELPDGGIQSSPSQVISLVTILREHQPNIVFAPYAESRHPDHLNAHILSRDALFMANLKKYSDLKAQLPYSVGSIYWYMARMEFNPSILLDITAFKTIKEKAVNAYISQLDPDSKESHETLVGSSLSKHAIEARDAYYGSMAGVRYAEPFFHDSPILVSSGSIFLTKQNSNLRYIYPNNMVN